MHKTSETFCGSRTDHIRITEWLCGGDGDFHPSDVISSLEHSRIQDGNPVLWALLDAKIKHLTQGDSGQLESLYTDMMRRIDTLDSSHIAARTRTFVRNIVEGISDRTE